MNAVNRRPGFTLVELLTVIAIISLLIGILVPSLSRARDQAKAAQTSGQISSLTKACEMFFNDFQGYPQSSGQNPFEQSANARLAGAQWLALTLVGTDRRGYVKPETRNDTNNDGAITYQDWLNWYMPPPAQQYTRLGPYMDTGARISTPESYARDNTAAGVMPAVFTQGSSVWKNSNIPFFTDSWEFPILYYAANRGATDPFTVTFGRRATAGLYDQNDNFGFTGTDTAGLGSGGATERGWDLGSGPPTAPGLGNLNHPLGRLGYDSNQPTQRPVQPSFAHSVYDEKIFDTAQGRVWPRNPDSFILVSPGKDGWYGTDDDITNLAKQ